MVCLILKPKSHSWPTGERGEKENHVKCLCMTLVSLLVINFPTYSQLDHLKSFWSSLPPFLFQYWDHIKIILIWHTERQTCLLDSTLCLIPFYYMAKIPKHCILKIGWCLTSKSHILLLLFLL